jgi:hypothetical protein
VSRRSISGLRWSRPCLPVHARSRGASPAKRLGLSFEAKVGNALPHALAGVWFEFHDDNGRGFCQPDFLLATPSGISIIETKLTYTKEAWVQLRGLYLPVVRWWLEESCCFLPIRVAQVCKNLTREWPPEDVGHSLDSPHSLVHWLGHSPLATQTIPFPPNLLATIPVPAHTGEVIKPTRRSSIGKTQFLCP